MIVIILLLLMKIYSFLFLFMHSSIPVFKHFPMLPGKRIVRMNDCFNAHGYSPFNRLLPEPVAD